MAEKQLQNYLYRHRTKIIQELRPIRLSKTQYMYIKTFIKKNSRLLKISIGLLVAITLIEILLPLVTDFYIKKYAYLLEIDKLVYSLLGLLGILISYLFLSFLSIKAEKTFTLYFLNDLRHKWFASYLNRAKRNLRGQDKGKLLTKITYHFSLMHTGITNSVFPIFNWLFLAIGLVVCGFFLKTSLLIVVLVSLPVSIVLASIGYMISKYYVGRDQTLYSKILRYVNDSLEEFDSVKANGKEREILRKFDGMVDLDTFFRIRRDLWLKYGGRIMFVLISLTAGSIYLYEIYNPFLQAETSAEYVVYGIFFALLIKLFYLGLRIGLFSYPAILGLLLCVPDELIHEPPKQKSKLSLKSLILKSAKIRLGRGGEYKKNVEFDFSAGSRVLIVGKEGSGKSTIAGTLAGQVSPSRAKAWVFKFNGARLLYSKWFKICKSIYYIAPEYRTENTLLSNFTSLDESKVESKEMQRLIDVLKYEHFSFLIESGRAIGRSIGKNSFSSVEKALMQIAYALYRKPPVVILDNIWLDIDDKRINESLAWIESKLPDTVIVCFSSKDNSVLNYDKKYNI
jgi:ABC-type multidrug transport system fused ATPase/permease subunit